MGLQLDRTPPFPLGITQFHWDEHYTAFDWTTVSMAGYAQVAQGGSTNEVIRGLALPMKLILSAI